jgi:tetratricopeptide (TPR) repeat protein
MSKNDQPKRDKRRRERREEHERLQRELGRVNDLLEDDAFDQAEVALDALARRFPDRLEVLELQANLAQEQKRWPAAVDAYERWSRLAPDDADVAFALGFVYGASASIVLAAKTWRDAVARWPQDPRTPKTRELLDTLERDLVTGLALFPGEGAAREDLACRHERILLLMSGGWWPRLAASRRRWSASTPTWPRYVTTGRSASGWRGTTRRRWPPSRQRS